MLEKKNQVEHNVELLIRCDMNIKEYMNIKCMVYLEC